VDLVPYIKGATRNTSRRKYNTEKQEAYAMEANNRADMIQHLCTIGTQISLLRKLLSHISNSFTGDQHFSMFFMKNS